MRIGIDCRTILNVSGGERAGIGHYTYYLVKNLLAVDKKNEYILFFDSRFKGFEEFKKYHNATINFFPLYQYKKFLPIIYSQIIVSAVLNKADLDIFHSPANIIPLYYHKKSIITVHDLGIYKYPEFFPKKAFNRQPFSTKVLVPNSMKKASKIIAVSKNTKKDIIEEFKIPEEKIEIVPEGVLDNGETCSRISNFSDLAKKYGLQDNFILFIGTIEPRKNIVNIIKAFRNLCLAYGSPLREYQLVIAGSQGWSDQPVYKAIADANASILGIKEKRNGTERRQHISSMAKKKLSAERRSGLERRQNQPVKYIGYVSHDEKMALLCQAKCFVFPSFYEGFGLPVLEAMNLGVPVITSNISSLPEITGSDGALLVDPHKESEITEALQRLITDKSLRESLIIAGREKSKSFSWFKCARETLAVYNSLK
ncbi:MAG: glycosyltransferase family 1 protein [Candidatus Buchananbacteria bacterium]|nr:glycosyltransferase family 1 protein [Candidatus Buchananbacteria bacterium]